MCSPILPKTFAGYIHPLRSRYTQGSDGQTGLSQNEVTRLRTDIAISKVMTTAEKEQANALVDQAREMTVAAQGSVGDKTKQAMLDLAKHELDFQPMNKGSAAPAVNFAESTLGPDQLRSRFFRMAAATSYSPANSRMEGGPKDSVGKPLKGHTIEEYVEALKQGDAAPNQYVAIAMDQYLYKGQNTPMEYGDVFRIPEIEAIYEVAPIYFALVDNGGAFKHTDGTKVDICSQKSYNEKVNQSVSLHQMLKPDGCALNIRDLDDEAFGP